MVAVAQTLPRARGLVGAGREGKHQNRPLGLDIFLVNQSLADPSPP